MKPAGYATLIIASFAFALAGWFIGNGIIKSRADERYVSVKGLAEREVQADRVVWTLSYISADNDLDSARKKLLKGRNATIAFLEKYGLKRNEISHQNLRIQDQLARTYVSDEVPFRYLLQETVLVRTDHIEAVTMASNNIGGLLEAGVLLGNLDGYVGYEAPQYIYTKLNDIKPDMIAEATANARLAAQKFAKDADTEISGIRRARQGNFQILATENAIGLVEAYQVTKKVRVVTTLDYILKN